MFRRSAYGLLARTAAPALRRPLPPSAPLGCSWRGLSTEAAAPPAAEEYTGPRLSVVSHPPPEDYLAQDSALSLAENPEWVGVLEAQPHLSGAPGEENFAIVAVSGAQHKVVEGDKLVVTKVPSAAVGQEMVLSGDDGDVLLVGSCAKTAVGRPGVPGAKVTLFCEEQTRDAKIIVFKKKRRKGYRRKNGYRRDITVFRVTNIDYDYGEE
mmetsp:Transcript_32399/g.102951  ORF Transcript_32399/g.102951 Transcript_32399/m.102951 type:complete len:210 (-) Transcript_32399:133-762(-)